METQELTVEQAVEMLVAVLNEKSSHFLFTYEEASKYFRIIDHYSNGQKGIHAFVDKSNGDVIKPASWSSPARGKNGLAVRFNLLNEESRNECFERCDDCGGYLYAR